MQPDYNSLFKMTNPLATRPFRLETYDDEWLGSREVDGLLRGEFKLAAPLKLRPARGGQPTDIMWSSWVSIIVISQRVLDMLTAYGLTGWSTYPVEVRDKQGQVLSGYYGFAVTGRAGKRDLRRVTVVMKRPWAGGKLSEYLRGIYFEGDFWDGSDFCLMGRTITMIVTRRVAEAFKRAKISNVKFIPLFEVETAADTYEVMGLWPLNGRARGV